MGIDADLLIKKAKARPAIENLINSRPLSSSDLISLGRLNSYCVLEWYEPMVVLIEDPRISPNLVAILKKYTKLDI